MKFIKSILRGLFGSFAWQAPRWWATLAQRVANFVAWARANRALAAGSGAALLAVTAIAVGGAWWWKNRPQPQYTAISLTAPSALDLDDVNAKPLPLVLEFSDSVAPLTNIDKAVTEGVALSPVIEGVWTWSDETHLSFTPRQDWPVGESYRVRLQPKQLLRTGAALKEDTLNFKSPEFTANVTSSEFYQDPTEPQLKKVVVTVKFSHPVDARSFEDHFRLRFKDQKPGVLGLGAETTAYEVNYSDKHNYAYVRSRALALPDVPTEMLAKLGEGVRSSRGGPGIGSSIEVSVKVPGRFSLQPQDTSLTFVSNDRLETDQILNITMSEGVSPEELRKHLKAYLLPVYHPDTAAEKRKEPFAWNTPALVADEILKVSQPLALESVPAGSDYPQLHSFKYRADVGRFVYYRLTKGVKSFGLLETGKRFDGTLQVPELPKEVKLLASGSLLSLRGERKVSLYSRDVPAIRYEVGRVLPDKLYMLATQATGNFSKPEFNSYSMSFDDLAEREFSVQSVPEAPAGRAQYHGFDLSPYLTREGHARTGVFMLRLSGWDPANKTEIGTADERLILVTDLGLLVKRSVDGAEDVFVQSISTGLPVAGAAVQVIGRNGIAVVSRTTDDSGHVQLPSMRDFKREKAPSMYIVRKDDDASFLPVSSSDRLLDVSRFDVGGVSNASESGQLNAYLFSDRGIYRPGDEIRVGMIVKAASWAKSLTGIPLEAQVTDARGTVVKRQLIKLSAAGFEELRYATSESSPTGVYNVALYITKDGRTGARLGSTVVNVQEFLPDRLKLALRFSEDREDGWVSPQDLTANVSLRTLFDTPGAARRVTARMNLSPRLPAFPAWREFRFTDPLKAKKSFDDDLGEVTTDDKGEAALKLNLQRFDAGTYSLSLVAQGFEAGGGRGVSAARTLMVSSMLYLVGLKPDGEFAYLPKDSKHSVELIAIDPALKRTAVEGLQLSLIERRYVSVLEKQDNGTLKYESRLKEIPIKDEPLALTTALVTRPVPTGIPGDFALLVRDVKGRELNRVEFSVAGAANVSRNLDRNAELEVRLAKPDFVPGEDIELAIRAPFTGSGLITIERERVHAFHWFRADTTSSVQHIKLPEGFEGNGYVTVSFVRDANSKEVFMSPLSYGVVPFSVNLDRRRVKVALNTAEKVKPGQILDIHYSTTQPTRLVLFGVDEGILQVAGYKNPDPLKFFFEKRALEVATRQILDLILPEFQQLVQAAPGGDDAGGSAKYLNPFKRKRDKPVVFWSGVIDAGPKEQVYHYTVPEYFNGSMRVLAVAVAPDAVGVAAQSSIVRGDFVILPNAPLTVSPGDEFDLTASVTNNVEGSGAAAQVLTALKASDSFEVIGAPSITLPIGEKREAVARFRLRAKEKLGSGSLSLLSSVGNKSGHITATVSIRPASQFLSQLSIGAVTAGSVDYALQRGPMLVEKRRLDASLSTHPLAIAGALDAYLEEYPYGCTEQLVSQALPAVILSRRPEFGLTNIEAGRARYQRLLVELRARQHADGGFGYWPDSSEVAEYPTVYALHFLLEAQARGQNAPGDVLERGAEWLTEFASASDRNGGTLGEERARAFAIYVLTRMGRVTSNFANAEVERLDNAYKGVWRKDIAAVYLAASYKIMKQDRLARDLVSGVSFVTTENTWKIDWSDRGGSFYYSELTHNAQLLYFLARHFPERIKANTAEGVMAVARSAQREHNTLSSAYAVLALDAYADAVALTTPQKLALEEILRDGTLRPLSLPAGLAPHVAFTPDAAKLRFSASGPQPAFYSVTEAGYERTPATTPLQAGMEIIREFVDANGKPITKVRQGDELRVRVRFRSMSKRVFWDGVVVDVLPGGFEPILEDLIRAPQADQGDGRCAQRSDAAIEGGADASAGPSDGSDCRDPHAAARSGTDANTAANKGRWYAEHIDVREDRVIAFGAIGTQVSELTYRVRATTPGNFAVPAAYAESMYDPLVRARSAATRISVEAR